MTILQDLSQTKANADVLAELELLREENAKLRQAKASKGVSLKVTEKGGVSMYGLGRFPVTLYRGQWERLIAHAEQVKDFIQANASQLSVKD